MKDRITSMIDAFVMYNDAFTVMVNEYTQLNWCQWLRQCLSSFRGAHDRYMDAMSKVLAVSDSFIGSQVVDSNLLQVWTHIDVTIMKLKDLHKIFLVIWECSWKQSGPCPADLMLMKKYFPSLYDVHREFRDALGDVLTAFTGHHINNLMTQDFNRQLERFRLACNISWNAVTKRLQEQHCNITNRRLQMKHSKGLTAIPDNAEPRPSLVPSSEGLGSKVHDTRNRDETDVSEEVVDNTMAGEEETGELKVANTTAEGEETSVNKGKNSQDGEEETEEHKMANSTTGEEETDEQSMA